MNEIAKLFSEESVIKFVDGTEIRGAKNVAGLIMRCCNVAIDGYIEGAKIRFVNGAIVGMVLAGTGITLYEVNKLIKKNKSKKQIEKAK
jgi:hypothetical protein